MAVFSDCNSTGTNIKSSGHVTFVFGKLLDKNTYIGLGGNQGDMITLSSYSETGISNSFCGDDHGCVDQKFYGFYLPKDYEIKESDYLTDNDIYNETIDTLNNKILKAKTQTNENESTF